MLIRDYVFSPAPINRKKCDALPFAKALPPIYIASEPNNRSNALESRDSQGSRRNRLNRSTLGKSGENVNVSTMNRSHGNFDDNLVRRDLVAFQRTILDSQNLLRQAVLALDDCFEFSRNRHCQSLHTAPLNRCPFT